MSSRHEHLALEARALDRRLWAAAILNVAITLAEVAGGLASGSLALLSDAAHNFSDVAAVLVALWARRMSRRAPTLRHTYGLKRIEVLAALGNAVALIAVVVLIAREAVLHLLHPTPVAQGVMLAVALVALGANAASVLLLRRHDRKDVNVRGAFVHLAQDALASLMVVVAALLANTGMGAYVDGVAALLVGLVALRSALTLGWETLSTLLEGTPRDLDLVELAERVAREFAPARLHHVHVWEIGPAQRLLTAHLALGREMKLSEIEAFTPRLKRFLQEHWAINHATIEPEVTGCSEQELLGRWRTPSTDELIAEPSGDDDPARQAGE